jgi:LysM repeat protein
LELALIYHQRKNDYIKAVYHYERYLEKRPAAEKRPLILDWVRQAKISLAGEIGRTSGDISEELVRLKRENNLLKQQLEAFEGKTAPAPTVANVKTIVTEPPVVTQKTIAAVEPKPEPTKPVEPVNKKIPKTYTVRSGDTLSQIARTVYGESSQWRKIYEANRDKMESENDLRAGQVINIPNLGN